VPERWAEVGGIAPRLHLRQRGRHPVDGLPHFRRALQEALEHPRQVFLADGDTGLLRGLGGEDTPVSQGPGPGGERQCELVVRLGDLQVADDRVGKGDDALHIVHRGHAPLDDGLACR
jgi:hypothetical protein